MVTVTDRVVIVGGGPAGLSCAIRLRQLGWSEPILVLDRTDRTVEPKLCGGLLTTPALEMLKALAPNISADIRPLSIGRASAPWSSCRAALPWPFGAIDRCQLNRHLEAAALGLGVELIKGREATVTRLDDRTVDRRAGRPIGFRYLVGADGASSIVRRSLKLPPVKTIGLTREFHVLAPLTEFLFEWYTTYRGFGYNWAWPITAYSAVIGSGIFGPTTGSVLGRQLERFAETLRIRPSTIAKGAVIPLDYQGSCFGNRFLIGDAAALADDLSGEGIRAALDSAIDIAERIINPAHPCPRLRRILAAKRWHRLMSLIGQRLPFAATVALSLIPLIGRTERGRALICRFFHHTPPR